MHQVTKDWSFSFSTSPSNEYSGLISFRIDWFNLLAIQGTLKSVLQHHSSKASILWGSTFFVVQLSHPYMTTGKAIALSIWTFIYKVMSLLFNTLSRFVIAFLPRSKYLLISVVTFKDRCGGKLSRLQYILFCLRFLLYYVLLRIRVTFVKLIKSVLFF